MSAPKIILTTVITTLTVLFFGGVIAASMWPYGAEAHGFKGMGGGHGFRGGNRHERFVKHCQRLSPAHTRVVEAMITAGLGLDDSQQAALDPIMTVVDEWRSNTAATCAQLPASDVDGHLAAAEQMLANSATAIAKLRPAYEQFYGQLDTEQKLHIDEMLQRHHGEGRHDGGHEAAEG